MEAGIKACSGSGPEHGNIDNCLVPASHDRHKQRCDQGTDESAEALEAFDRKIGDAAFSE